MRTEILAFCTFRKQGWFQNTNLQLLNENMKKNADYPYGLSLTLCGLGVLLFAYFAFMGLDYHYNGSLLWPGLMTVTGGILLAGSLWCMCRSKRNRQWRRGLWRELCFSALTLAIVTLGSLPVNIFIHIARNQDEVMAGVSQKVMSLRCLDDNYRNYVDLRVARYDSLLKSQRELTGRYKQLLGSVDTQNPLNERNLQIRINKLCESLRRRLIPERYSLVMELRNAWMDQLDEISVWNVFAPRNILLIDQTGRQWGEELVRLSQIQYFGELSKPYDVTEFSAPKIFNLDEMHTYQLPDMQCAFVIVLLLFMMLLPYWMARRPKTGHDGTHV